MLKLVVDENIAFPEAFELFGRVKKVNGREISNSLLRDCDVLITRSITKVDENLLENTKVKFVGTATSGSEHIDIEYLDKKNIYFTDAKGCNSFAVAEYVISAISKLLADSNECINNKKIGIIGYGNIGAKVASMCRALGMEVKFNDPPLKRINSKISSVDLDKIFQCDIISLHVPLTFSGIDKTFNLLDDNLSMIKEGTILINTSRGGVINEKALLKILEQKKLKLVIDVWSNEPRINNELLGVSAIATPHIAGYSTEGKVNGTKMIFEKLNNFLNTNYHFDFQDTLNLNQEIEFVDELNAKSLNLLFKKIYDIETDSLKTKKILDIPEQEKATYFDQLRKNYLQRKSFKDYLIKSSNVSLKETLESLRFQVRIT